MSAGQLRRASVPPLLSLSALLLTLACGGAEGGRSDGSTTSGIGYPRFDGGRAYDLVERQVAFGPRVPGTPGHEAMAGWMEQYLAQRADTLILQRFTHITSGGDSIRLVNMLARFQPSTSRSLLLLAHWDTRPISDNAPTADERDTPVPGANDGGSGTAVLLQLAEMMRANRPPGSVDLLFVDGEDYGDFGTGHDVFLGSRYFAANLPDGYAPQFGVLLDMVGDRDLGIYVEGNSNRLAPEVVDRVWGIARRLGFGDIFQREIRHTINDDHIPLNDVGIKTIDVIDFDYAYWHTPQDALDKISASSLGVVGEVMARLIYRGR